MIAAALGIMLGLAIGMGCRWFDIPLPAPPRLVGALLVVAMTSGFTVTAIVLETHNQPSVTAFHPEGARHE